MKLIVSTYRVFVLVITFVFIVQRVHAQSSFGIGTLSPHSSAVLDITSADKGLLIPRLTLAQRPASPALGLVYFQTDAAAGFYYFNGSIWKFINPDAINTSGTAGQIPYYNSSNTITGTNSFVWDNTNQRLGIGTNTPSSSLEVNGSNYIVANLKSSSSVGSGINLNSTGNSSYTLLATGTGAGAGTGKLGIYDETTGSYRMVIDGAGNLGLGTTGPSSKMEVSGTGGLKVSTTNTGTGTADWVAGNFGGTTGNRVVIGLNDGNATIGAHNSTLSGWSNLLINPGGGNVGIGTTSPATGLHVKSTTSGAILSLEGTTQSYIQLYPNGYSSGRKGWFGFGSNGTELSIINENNGNILLLPGTGANVGVGNSNPQQKLDVTGTIRSSALLGTGNRMVVADVNGDLSTQAIPSLADDLGNHTATQNINLAANKLVGNGGTNGIAIANDGTTTVNALAGIGNRMVVANATGGLTTQAIPTGDNLGNHTATQNINLNNNWVSNNGTATGIRVDNSGNVGINLAAPQGVLDVPYYVSGSPVSGGLTVKPSGNVGIGTNDPTANLDVVGTVRFRNGAGNNKILKSDANGNATWSATLPISTYSVATPSIPAAVYPNINFPGGLTTPTIGTATLDWTHNLGYQPIIMCSIDQSTGANAEFVKVAYQHVNNNTIRFKFSNTSTSVASGSLKIVLMN